MIYSVGEYDVAGHLAKIEVEKRKRGNQGTRHRRAYRRVLCAFDIETTRLEEIEQAVMYVWQFQIGDDTIIGRTWEEFTAFTEELAEALNGDWLVVFVHNLSYEFQYLRGVYDFGPEDVFIVDERKILKCDMLEALEFRCSYLQTNMSLAEFTRRMGVEHGKASPIDYSLRRFSWTPLSDEELTYIVNDVAGLVEAMRVRIYGSGDNLYSVPLTSTGYVRRDAKRAMRHYNRARLKKQLPDMDVYLHLREAFRGGNTHANRYYANQIIEDVHSWDRSSSYPDCQVNDRFPMGQWFKEPEPDPWHLIDRLMGYRACLFRCSFTNIRLTDRLWGCPYLSRDKCRNIGRGVWDNGRILSAAYLETTLTDIDLDIILKQYTFDDFRLFTLYHTRYGKLPAPLTDLTKEYYRRKTELKGVEGEELAYLHSKELLNSVYGMSVQDPAKQSIKFINGDYEKQHEPLEDLLQQANGRAFQSYAWGVWVTANARRRLEEGIRLVGSGFVYCDTDSVKYIGDVDWSAYNEERKKASEKNGAFADDPAGHRHYMGVYEHEDDYEQFITMGAKKYGVVQDGKIYITIAGVGKKKGAEELARAGGLSAFREGFTFFDAGGTESVYNDEPPMSAYEVEGRQILITSNVVIRPSTYTLGITADYQRILQRPDLFENF